MSICAHFASAFSFLDHPNPAAINSGSVHRWPEYNTAQPAPIVLTYAIADDFLLSEGPQVRAAGIAAVERALQRWSDASRGMIRFEPSAWGAVRNIGTPPNAFVGPSLQEWIDWFTAGQPDPQLPPPGWGAHIDFFSAPPGYSFNMGSVPYHMTGCNLGFAAIWRQGSTSIRSVDIYLNEKWTWTDDENEVTPINTTTDPNLFVTPDGKAFPPIEYAGMPSTFNPRPIDSAIIERSAGGCSGLNLTVDLETVLVHEIGHALGLDHPDEAVAKGSQSLEAYLFMPEGTQPASFFRNRVMYSLYTGLKRELTDDEIGALVYLYPPALPGDLDADGQVTIADWTRAAAIYDGSKPPNPWDVVLMDFNTRNAVIDPDEFRQMTLWILDPFNNPPGSIPSQSGGVIANQFRTPTSITVDLLTSPEDVGVGGVIAVTLTIENPDLLPVSGWEIKLQYDSEVLSNPRFAGPPTFVPSGTWAPLQVTYPSPGIGQARLIRFAFMSDSSPSGNLCTVLFDIDLNEAAAVWDVLFDPVDVQITVDDPFPHLFGLNPNFPEETLFINPILVPASNFDINQDTVFDAEDLYDFEANPVDVTGDGDVTDADRQRLREFLRREETATVAPGRSPQPGN